MVNDTSENYHKLCDSLNIDRESIDEAWNNYQSIKQNYTLEGDQLHWLACALYVACRKSTKPTVGIDGVSIEGNCVSLTALLKHCNLSLLQFFSKSKKWADMANMPQEFRTKIDRLERNFAVSMVIFKKFKPIFWDIFQSPTQEIQKIQRSRKQRHILCGPSQVFDFAWTLFISVKGEFPDVSDDLVNSYHLLLCCCDLMYANALIADRRDLLRSDFSALPENFWDTTKYTVPSDVPCIIEELCKKHDGIIVEAKGIKEYHWKNSMKKFFEKKTLRGLSTNFTGVLELTNFDLNWKGINRFYETYLLSAGDFDERIFLGVDASSEIGTPTKQMHMEISEEIQAKKDQNPANSPIYQLVPNTPLTNRRYLKNKEIPANVTPVSTATQSVSRLQNLLAGRTPAPSKLLLEIFQSCSRNSEKLVAGIVSDLGQKFCANYTQNSATENSTPNQQPPSGVDFANKRLQLAQTLYYKLVENILLEEKKKKPEGFDFSNLLEQEVLHQMLFACCLQIVIYSYNSQRTFPWILEALSLDAYHFYKVIEIIVRNEDQLSRDMVKHLNLIEEQILEALAWKSSSPLWAKIEEAGCVPQCEKVCLPGQLEVNISSETQTIRRVPNITAVPNSPISSVSDRFLSPVNSSAKKPLFTTGDVRPGQSLLNNNAQKPVTIQKNSQIVVLKGQQMSFISSKEEENRNRKYNSLGLFFRKFYHMASVRLLELCNQLNVIDGDLKRKIWTCFEYSITQATDLMRDRHLDQILMCAVYIMCKIAQLDKSFTNIMKCYREQPQAASHVYRSVLLKTKPKGKIGSKEEKDKEQDKQENRRTSQPQNMAGTSNSFEYEDRGDLIKFYNTVYVQFIQQFALRFTPRVAQENKPNLSPLPLGIKQPMSPRRRVSDKHSVFVRPLEASMAPTTLMPATPPAHEHLSYCFSRSPAKDLRAINEMIQIDSRRVGKRRILSDEGIDGDGATPAKQPTSAVTRKLQDLIGDRRGQNVE